MRQAALWTLAGLAVTLIVVAAAFVLPHWTRLSLLQLADLRDAQAVLRLCVAMLTRLTWFPILHDTFTRMWVELVRWEPSAAWGVVLRWRRATRRRASLVLVGRGRLARTAGARCRQRAALRLPHPRARGADRDGPRPTRGLLPAEAARYHAAARLLLALAGDSLPRLHNRWADRRVCRFSTRSGRACAGPRRSRLVLGIVVIVDLAPRSRPSWRPAPLEPDRGRPARPRTDEPGSRAVRTVGARPDIQELSTRRRLLGRALPPETLVQGKLANGLSLENRIRPVFIGHGFGNYATASGATMCDIF